MRTSSACQCSGGLRQRIFGGYGCRQADCGRAQRLKASRSCMGHGDPPIRHHDHQIPQAQFEARVPAHTPNDDLSVEVPSFEQIFDRDETVASLHNRPPPSRLHQSRFFSLACWARFGFLFPEAAAGMGSRGRVPAAGRRDGAVVVAPAPPPIPAPLASAIQSAKWSAMHRRCADEARSVYFCSTNQANQAA